MLNTGPVIMPMGGRTIRDGLGITSAFRGAPDFGGLNFVATPGSQQPNGYLNHPGAPAYGAPEDDPRDRYLDPRLSGLDPRNRPRAQQALAQQAALQAASQGATAASLAQLRALQAQLGGRGMPSAARGGRYAGGVRVHAGEIAYPDGRGGVGVIDPITAQMLEHGDARDAQQVDQQFGQVASDANAIRTRSAVPGVMERLPMQPHSFNPDVQESPDAMHSRLMRESDARVAAGVAAAQPVAPGRFREIAGRDSYSPSGAGGGGLTPHDQQMQQIIDGSLHPDSASPEVRSAFMERWQRDPRWARQVSADWNRPQGGPSPEQQQAASDQFRQESAAREAALTPMERDARDARRAELDRQSTMRSVVDEAAARQDRSLRRQAIVSDMPLDQVKGPDANYSINDVLFERGRDRRDAAAMGHGATTYDARSQRRGTYEAIRAGRAQSEAQVIAAATRGSGRGDATVDAARISAAGRILASPDATPEQKAVAQQIIAGTGSRPMAGQATGEDGLPTSSVPTQPLPSSLHNATDEVKRKVTDVLGLRPTANPDDPTAPREWRTRIDEDIKDLGNIENPSWFSDDPGALGVYRSSLGRVVSRLREINGLDDDARAVAIDVLSRQFQRSGWANTDWANVSLSGNTGFDRLIHSKREIQKTLLRMSSGKISNASFDAIENYANNK